MLLVKCLKSTGFKRCPCLNNVDGRAGTVHAQRSPQNEEIHIRNHQATAASQFAQNAHVPTIIKIILIFFGSDASDKVTTWRVGEGGIDLNNLWLCCE
jgi:hypothetical protein